MANVHMGMVGASEHYENDPLTNILHRRIRSPKSLRPHLIVLSDDLYRAYNVGIKTIDYSYPREAPGRNFLCKVVLLFWTGDYPANALVSGIHSKTCHWCHVEAVYFPEVSRVCYGDYRCWLQASDPKRHHGKYGRNEDRPTPLTRTHLEFINEGIRNDQYTGPKNRAPYKASGIKELSPLGVLPLFDLVWDITGDMMHILWGIWKRHIFEMLDGLRAPSKPKPRTSWTANANRKLDQDYTAVIIALEEWTLSPQMKKVVHTLYTQCLSYVYSIY